MTVEDDDDKIICPCCNGELGELSLEPSMILNLIFVVCEKKCGKDVTLFDYANHKLLCNNGKINLEILLKYVIIVLKL